jgi:hypothetical protein
MASQHVDITRGSRRPRGVARWQPAGAGARRKRLVGWLAAASLLAHGWLPIVLQSSLAGHDGGARHAHHGHPMHEAAVAAPNLHRSGHGQDCPIFHHPICLCAVFVSFLMPASAPVPAPAVVRGARRRWPRPARRPLPVVVIRARAPPRLR